METSGSLMSILLLYGIIAILAIEQFHSIILSGHAVHPHSIWNDSDQGPGQKFQFWFSFFASTKGWRSRLQDYAESRPIQGYVWDRQTTNWICNCSRKLFFYISILNQRNSTEFFFLLLALGVYTDQHREFTQQLHWTWQTFYLTE